MSKREALEDADRHLAGYADACLDAGDEIPDWVIVARKALQYRMADLDDD